ncbi:MAG: type II toxin-antitoxin system YafQ family toxin [Propionibacteriaceae bacterium]|jgi:mRNA interferase YafQ|nr:type II toxin-antitoxin system YafQ family toxin [Propionibacteriaceae bacterium]
MNDQSLALRQTSQFKRDLKRLRKRGADLSLLDAAVSLLLKGDELPSGYRDHVLFGDYAGAHECHIRPDWLFVYERNHDCLVLVAMRTGSHSGLFRCIGRQEGCQKSPVA